MHLYLNSRGREAVVNHEQLSLRAWALAMGECLHLHAWLLLVVDTPWAVARPYYYFGMFCYWSLGMCVYAHALISKVILFLYSMHASVCAREHACGANLGFSFLTASTWAAVQAVERTAFLYHRRTAQDLVKIHQYRKIKLTHVFIALPAHS